MSEESDISEVMADHIDQFNSMVEDFLAETGMAESRFGRLACNDSTFVSDMRDGREAKRVMIARVDAFIRGYRLGRSEALGDAHPKDSVAVVESASAA